MCKNEMLRTIISQKFSSIRERNPSYSKRKFAKDLGVSSGSLIDFMAKKRNFGPKTIHRIVSSEKFSSLEIEKIKSTPLQTLNDNDIFKVLKMNLDESGFKEFISVFLKFKKRCLKIQEKKRGLKSITVEILESPT